MSIKKGYKVIAGAPLEAVWGNISGDITDQADLQQALSEKVGAYSPAFIGTPTAPTPPTGSYDDRIATTSYVQQAIESVDGLPSQVGHNGQFLTTNGTSASWGTVDALPSQSGQSGKFLTTNGTTASWGDAVAANTAITAATHTKITYDSKGLVTGGEELVINDIPDLTSLYQSTFTLSFAGNWTGGLHLVKFLTVDYTTCNSENGVFIKISMVNSHGNGITGRFYQDVTFNVNYTGTVSGTIYRYFAETVEFEGDYYGKHYGDIFWTIDTENKIVKFFVLMRQYSYTFTTPYFRLNVSTKGIITQSTGVNNEEYSSGTQYWLEVNDLENIPTEATVSGWGFTKNVGTVTSVNNISPINGNVDIDALPSQSGQSGKFLTTNGTTASWGDTLPSQSGNSGKYLTTNGTTASWATVDALPTQAGQSGKFLTTDGNNASWAAINALQNTATGTNSLAILTNTNTYMSVAIGNGSLSKDYAVSLGTNATASGMYGIAIGEASEASAIGSIALGEGAKSTATYAIQISKGTNNEANSLYVATSTSNNWKLLGSDGIIPQARLASGGTNGQVLMTNGTTASWENASGSTITYWEDD